MKRYTEKEEADWLQLVCEVQAELSRSLNSLGGQPVKGALDKFTVYSAGHLNRAVDAFVQLRRLNALTGSKFLVRPIIEILFRLQAVHEKPSLLYRLAYTERKLAIDRRRASAKRRGIAFDENEDVSPWDEFRRRSLQYFPATDLVDKRIKLIDVANEGGLIDYYNSHYRLYCSFTHGAMEAIIGELNPISDREDCRVVAGCGVRTLVLLEKIGAEVLKLKDLDDRLLEFLCRDDEELILPAE